MELHLRVKADGVVGLGGGPRPGQRYEVVITLQLTDEQERVITIAQNLAHNNAIDNRYEEREYIDG